MIVINIDTTQRRFLGVIGFFWILAIIFPWHTFALWHVFFDVVGVFLASYALSAGISGEMTVPFVTDNETQVR